MKEGDTRQHHHLPVLLDRGEVTHRWRQGLQTPREVPWLWRDDYARLLRLA